MVLDQNYYYALLGADGYHDIRIDPNNGYTALNVSGNQGLFLDGNGTFYAGDTNGNFYGAQLNIVGPGGRGYFGTTDYNCYYSFDADNNSAIDIYAGSRVFSAQPGGGTSVGDVDGNDEGIKAFFSTNEMYLGSQNYGNYHYLDNDGYQFYTFANNRALSFINGNNGNCILGDIDYNFNNQQIFIDNETNKTIVGSPGSTRIEVDADNAWVRFAGLNNLQFESKITQFNDDDGYVWLSADGNNIIYEFGDIGGQGSNARKLRVSENGPGFQFCSQDDFATFADRHGTPFLLADTANQSYYFGDSSGSHNGTCIRIRDSSRAFDWYGDSFNYQNGSITQTVSGYSFLEASSVQVRFGNLATGGAEVNVNRSDNVVSLGGGQIRPIRFVTADYTTIFKDYTIAVNKATGSATTITLLPLPYTGQIQIIKDKKGDAATNNITVNGNGKTIDGASIYAISTNRGSVTLMFDGAAWNILSKF